MNHFIPPHIVATALLACLAFTIAAPDAMAQRGPAFMNGAGYQRALAESRQRLQQRPSELQTRGEKTPDRRHKRGARPNSR